MILEEVQNYSEPILRLEEVLQKGQESHTEHEMPKKDY